MRHSRWKTEHNALADGVMADEPPDDNSERRRTIIRGEDEPLILARCLASILRPENEQTNGVAID